MTDTVTRWRGAAFMLPTLAIICVLMGPALGYRGLYVSHFCVSALAVVVLVRAISGQSVGLGRSGIVVVSSIILYASFQALFAASPLSAVAHTAMLVASFGSLTLCYFVSRNVFSVDQTRLVILVFFVLLIAVCVCEFVFGLRLPVSRYSSFNFANSGLEPPLYNVPTGFYGNQNNLALLILIAYPFCDLMRARLPRLLAQTGLAAIVLATDSRIAIASLASIICIRLFLSCVVGRYRWSLIAMALLVAPLFLIIMNDAHLTCTDKSKSKFCVVLDLVDQGAGLDEIADRPDSIGVRVQLTSQALKLWAQEPFFGIGPGASGQNVSADHFQYGFVHDLHNPTVEVLTEYGLVGAIPWVVGWILLLQSTAQIGSFRIRIAFFITVLTAPIFTATVSTLYFFTPFWGVIGMIAGLSCQLSTYRISVVPLQRL